MVTTMICDWNDDETCQMVVIVGGKMVIQFNDKIDRVVDTQVYEVESDLTYHAESIYY